MGPRQVGKTSLLLQLADRFLDQRWPASNLVYFDFRDHRNVPPAALADVLAHHPPAARSDVPRILLLDEITALNGWDLALKGLVDATRRAEPAGADRILVTDSSASLLRGGSRDSLQGRIDEHRIEGLTFMEHLGISIPRAADRHEALRIQPQAFERYAGTGGFPELCHVEDLALVRKRIREDVAEKAVRHDMARLGVDVARLEQLFVYLVRDSGAIFTAAERGVDLGVRDGDRGVDARTIRSWLALLEEAGLVVQLEPWRYPDRHAQAAPRLRAKPKVYAADHGMVSAFTTHADPLGDSACRARVFETMVFSHLRSLRAEHADLGLAYYSERKGREDGSIDFIVRSKGRVVGVEVTTSKKPRKKVAGVLEVARLAKLDGVVIVHDGLDERVDAPVHLVRIEEFLMDVERHTKLWS